MIVKYVRRAYAVTDTATACPVDTTSLPGVRGNPYNGLYGGVLPEKGPFLSSSF